MAYEPVMKSDDLWDGEMRPVVVANAKILLVRAEHEVFAYEDRCLHKGVPLSEGTISDNVITCCVHKWQYVVTTGKCLNPNGLRMKRFPVRDDGERIFVDPQGGSDDYCKE